MAKVLWWHCDNARTHVGSNDNNPRAPQHKKADLLARARMWLPEGPEFDSEREELDAMYKDELVEFLIAVEGKRQPELYKLMGEYGFLVERTPPYHPEFMPLELIWAQMEQRYAR